MTSVDIKWRLKKSDIMDNVCIRNSNIMRHHRILISLAALLLCGCNGSNPSRPIDPDDNGLASSTEIVERQSLREALIDAYYSAKKIAFQGASISKEDIEITAYYGCYRSVHIASFNQYAGSSLAVEFTRYYEDVVYHFGSVVKTPWLFHKGSIHTFDDIGSFGFTVADHRVIQSAIAAGSDGHYHDLDQPYDPTAESGLSYEEPEAPNLSGLKVGGAIVSSYYVKRETDYLALGMSAKDLRIDRFYGKFGDFYCFRFNCLPYSLASEGNYLVYGNVEIGWLDGEQIPWFWRAGQFYYWHQFYEPFRDGGLTEGDMTTIKNVIEGKETPSTDSLNETYRG